MYEKVWILGPYGIFESIGTVQKGTNGCPDAFFPRKGYIYVVPKGNTYEFSSQYVYFPTEAEAIEAAASRRTFEIYSIELQMKVFQQRLDYLKALRVNQPQDWKYSRDDKKVFGDLDCVNNHTSKVLEINLKKDNKAEILIETEI